MVATSSASASLKEYLRRYENTNEEEDKKKKKKRKKPKTDMTGVVVVDEDPVWQKPVILEEENEDSEAEEEKPQVDEDVEVKRMKRLEQLKARRPFGAISEDGSGWISISDTPQSLKSFEHSSDMSPPRKWRSRNDTPSPEPEPMPSGREATDFSPSRQKRYNSPSQEPATKSLCYSESIDISPPRMRRACYDTLSPETDLKPSDSSREVRDLSPPRQQRNRQYTPSPEPEMELSHSEADLDLFRPPRNRPQMSSEYKSKNSEISELPDISPPRRVLRGSSFQDELHAPAGADLSPIRRSRDDRSRLPDGYHQQSNRSSTEIVISRKSAVSDLSPPRKIRKESTSSTERPKTGLVTGRDVEEEIAKTKKEERLRFKDMDPSISGRGAEPVRRDKTTGQRLSKDQFLKSQKKEEKPKEIKLEWGKGLAQKREAEARQQELELEKNKPFARTRDDADLDRMLKERTRWGDPMAHLIKKNLELVLPDIGDDEKMQESGFLIPQEIPSHSWLKLGLDAAPNRYGIRPGRHWDGVDRSTGFEKTMFKRMNEKQATEREAYLWSVSDM